MSDEIRLTVGDTVDMTSVNFTLQQVLGQHSVFKELRQRPDDETTFLPKAKGAFDRGASRLQNWIDVPSSDSVFSPEAGRYHLFVNYGCGWCHQVLQLRSLRGLQSAVGVTHVSGFKTNARDRGTDRYLGSSIAKGADTSGQGFRSMRAVYNSGPMAVNDKISKAGIMYGTSQLTIPVLWDRKTQSAVSNDPAQILLMLDYWAKRMGGNDRSLYPAEDPKLRTNIEHVNEVVFPCINNGVYCCWFGHGAAFKEGVQLVRKGLEWLEKLLASPPPRSGKAGNKNTRRDFLCGTSAPSLADVRAFPHLIRFDLIYHRLMLRGEGPRIFSHKEKFPHLQAWVKRMFGIPEIFESCDLQFATQFYFSDKRPKFVDVEIYDSEKSGRGGSDLAWLPSRAVWAKKRTEEGLGDGMKGDPRWA